MTSTTKTSTLGVRLTAEEKAKLQHRAGTMGLGPYIRRELFEADGAVRQTRGKQPVKDWEAVGQILGLLAQSCLGPSLKDLSEAAKTGCLPLDDDTIEALLIACRDVATMKSLLMLALNVKED